MAGLPSARDLTLGKDGRFAECPRFDIRQRKYVCRVSDIGHSTKNSGLPSVRSGTLGKHAVTVSTPSRYFFRRALVLALNKVFAECPIENTRQRDVCRHCRCRVLFAKYFMGFAECLWHTAKPLFFVVLFLYIWPCFLHNN